MRLPTITVDRGGVAVVINKSDFREGFDRVFGATEPELTQTLRERFGSDHKDDLILGLARHGIVRDRRSSVETLEKLFADAQSQEAE